MKIGIVTAMDQEALFIIKEFGLKETKKLGHLSFYEGENIVLVLTGIGKIQAAFGVCQLVNEYGVGNIINIGIAGNLRHDEVCVGDVFLIKSVIQHDIYLPFDGSHLDYIKKPLIIGNDIKIDGQCFDFGFYDSGVCLTGDAFIDDSVKVEKLRSSMNGDVVDMEAFAVASIACELGLRNHIFVIKAVSDGADTNAIAEHEKNLEFAMRNSIEVLKKIFEKLSVG